MARERSLALVIRGQVEGARRALQDTAKAARQVGDESEKSSKRASTAGERLVRSARDNSEAWNTAGGAAVGFGVALTAGFAAATVANLGFEKSMSNVRAVTNASASEMEALTEAALDMGAQTVFSASEAATAQAELARAGVTTADILGGALKGSMDLAAAGGLDLADAAIISAQAMNLFNLEGKDVGTIADVLASGANKSAADVSDLGQALGQAGTVASQTGLSLQETVAALSMFADAGIRGSDAGTSLKSMLQRLTPQSKEAQRVMEDLGFSAFDAQGNFIGLEALAGELQSSFGGLDTESRQAALGVAFGSDAIRAASVLMEGGTAAARDYESAMNDQGAAARMAGIQMDNLAGDWEELTGSIETALIQGGSAANGFLRGLVSGATDVVNVYNELPAAVQGGATALAGVTGALSLAAGGALIAVPKFVQFSDAMRQLADISPRTASGLGKVRGVLIGPWGLAIAGAVTAIGYFAAGHAEAQAEAEELRGTLNQLTGGITAETRAWQARKLQEDGTFERYEQMGGNVRDLTRALEGDAAARERIGVVTQAWADAQDRASASTGGLGVNLSQGTTQAEMFLSVIDTMIGLTDEQAEKTRQLAEAQGDATDGTTLFGDSFTGLVLGMRDFATAQQAAVGGADLFLTAAEEAALGGEDAAQAYADWAAETRAVSESFVSAQGALGVANEAAQTWAQGVADATESADDSWETYVGDFTGTVDEWLAELERMQVAQSAWETNMLILASRASDGVVQAFEDLGPEGAVLLQEFLDGGVETLRRGEQLFGDEARRGTNAYAEGMANADVIRAAAARWGDQIAEELAAKLESGETTVAQAVSEYDLATEIELQADPDPFEGKLTEVLEFASGQSATARIEGDSTGYGAELGAALGTADASAATAEILGDPAPYLEALAGVLGETDRSAATAAILADANPAFGVLGGLLRTVSGSYAETTTGTRTGAAYEGVNGLLWWISQQSATVSVYTRMMGALNLGASLGTMPGNAAGGVYVGGMRAFAAGGFDDRGRFYPRRSMLGGPMYGVTNLTWPSSDGRGLVRSMEPSTRREAYISDHPAYRRQNIDYLKVVAGWYGLAVTKAFAAGGVNQPRYSSPAPMFAMAAAPARSDDSALAGQVAALSAAVASMPTVIEVPVYMDSRETARATARGMEKLGGRVVTSGRARIGRRS